MEKMKIARGIAPIVLILYLAIRDFFFFSSSKISSSSSFIPQLDDHDHQHQTTSSSSSGGIFYQILIHAKPSYLFIFFTFNTLLVAVLLGISSQLSKSSSSSTSSFNIELSISSFIDSYEGLKREKDEDIIKEEYKDDFIPGIVYYVDHYEEEKTQLVVESCHINMSTGTNFYFKNDSIDTGGEVYGIPYGYGYVHDQEEYKDDYIPGIVHVEYFKEETLEGQSNSEDIDQDCKKKDDDDGDQKDEILMSGEYDYDEETGSEEEEEGSYSELDDVDFNKRIEEFIVENNKKWREELQNDMLLLS